MVTEHIQTRNTMRTFLLLFILSSSFYVTQAQVTITGDKTDFTTTPTYTTPAGTDRLLLVGVACEFDWTTNWVGQITYGGETLTRAGDRRIWRDGQQYIAWFYLTENGISARSNDNISITYNAGTGGLEEDFVSIISLENVNQTDPVSSFIAEYNWGGSSVNTGPVMVKDGDMIVNISSHRENDGFHAPATGFTELHDVQSSDSHSSSYLSATATTSHAPGFSYSGSNHAMIMGAVAVQSNSTAPISPGGVSSGLDLWLRADAGTSTLTDGSGVTGWGDNAGKLNNTYRSTNASVTYETGANDLANFHPVIRFDDDDDELRGIKMLNIHGKTSMSSFLVMKEAAGANWENVFNFAGESDEHRIEVAENDKIAYFDNDYFDAYGDTDNLYAATSGLTGLFMFNGNYDGTNYNVYTNHMLSESTPADLPIDANYGPYSIGKADGFSATSANFDMAEVIVYDEDKSANEREKIASYLAVKYGLTLGDPGNPVSYLDANGNTIWSGSGTYQNDIAGIGRDDASGLNQKQSQSMNNADAIVTIGLNTIAATNYDNSNTFANDQAYMVWGNDDDEFSGTASDAGTTTNGENIDVRMKRVWRLTETGSVGTTRISIDMSSVPGVDGNPGTNDLAEVRLLVDGDGVFNSGATSVSPTSYDNTTDQVSFDYNFPANSNSFFTVGSVDGINAPLPVEWSDFVVKANGADAEMEWTVLKEVNNDYFTIEKSTNLKSWESIGRVEGQGNSNETSTYHFTDTDATGSQSAIYYRVRQTDFDGTHAYSNIENLSFREAVAVQCYPNPADNYLYVTVGRDATLPESTMEVTLQNIAGNYTQDFTANNGKPIDISSVPEGFYILSVQRDSRLLHRTKLLVK